MVDTRTPNPDSLGNTDKDVATDERGHLGARASNDDGGHPTTEELPSGLAHTSKSLTVAFNDNWQVVEWPRQWVLQRRSGKPRSKNPGWKTHAYCHTRSGLRLRIGELCGPVEAYAQATIDSLPEDISDR